MSETSGGKVGLTKTVGYEVGVRRTMSFRLSDAWRLVTSTQGINLWLGPT